jgi:hypothetical protein
VHVFVGLGLQDVGILFILGSKTIVVLLRCV